jgi:hypothetical protein
MLGRELEPGQKIEGLADIAKDLNGCFLDGFALQAEIPLGWMLSRNSRQRMDGELLRVRSGSDFGQVNRILSGGTCP